MWKQHFTFAFHSGGEGKKISELKHHMVHQSGLRTATQSIDMLSAKQGFHHN